MSVTPAPDKVEREISGTLTGVEMRQNGWHRFSILEPGNQYPYRADTKKKTLIDQAMALMNQNVTVAVTEQTSTNINEHTGEPFVNKYLNGIAAQGYPMGVSPTRAAWSTRTPTQAQQPVQQQNIVQPGTSGYEKDLTIWRQTASKVVACLARRAPRGSAQRRGDDQGVRGLGCLLPARPVPLRDPPGFREHQRGSLQGAGDRRTAPSSTTTPTR